MHCELVVPDLLGAGAEGRYPALELLLARSRRKSEGSEPKRLQRWLHDAFSVEGETIPAGALTLIAANRDPGSDSWMRADPVHLRLMRDHLVALPAEALTISREEAEAFCAALNSHFDGVMQVVALDPRRWVARIFNRALELPDVPALQVAGRQVPRSSVPDAGHAEMEMLLHAHPVNAARESRGEPTINSLWLWGAGRAGKVSSHWSAVLADEPLVMGLALLARARYRSLPPDAGQWLQGERKEGRHLVVLDALHEPRCLQEAERYHDKLAALEKYWFSPLLRALRAGRIGMITLHVPDAAVSFETVRGDLRRFWRRPKPLRSYE